MQVVIRMQDVERLTEVVDAVEGINGFSPDMETTEAEWCVAFYHTTEGAKKAEAIVEALLEQIEDHGLMIEYAEGSDVTPWEVKIS